MPKATKKKTWEELKQTGSSHYKANGVEPIDLYKSLGIFDNFAIANIIKYAARNARKEKVSSKDLGKIIHYTNLLDANSGDDK